MRTRIVSATSSRMEASETLPARMDETVWSLYSLPSAMAQRASDPRYQPGNSACRDGAGRRC
jgi:hypothetical protein